MTDHVSGSSLPQTRDLCRQQERVREPGNQHEHEHGHEEHEREDQEQQQQQTQPLQRDRQDRCTQLHLRSVDPTSHHHAHAHAHAHAHVHNRNHNHQHLHHAHSQGQSKLHQRHTSDDNVDSSSDVVVIVQTISVLQLIDAAGSTIIKTLGDDYPTAPVVTTHRSKPTKQPAPADLTRVTPTRSASDDGNGGADPSTKDPAITPSASSMPTTFPTLSYAPITSTPLSPVPVFSSRTGHSNSSLLSSAFGNSTASLHSFTTTDDRHFSIFGGATGTISRSSPTSSIFTKSGFGTSTSESSSGVALFTSTIDPPVTPTSDGNGIGSPANIGDGEGSGSTSASGSGSDNTPAATIAGSVVGAISGLTIILLLAAVFFRWKKRQSSMKLIQESGNDRGYGAMSTGGTRGPTGDGGMSEQRRPTPFAIPAALANLAGHSRFSKTTASSDGGERGFTKIAGRKLPPVLQFGGDGYSDPRGTAMSDQSIDYRASNILWGEAPLSRLAVGAPMLQETGAPILHSGPARTAVATPGPFSDPFSDDHVIASPTSPVDPAGRPHLPRDRSIRSHGSISRFTENL
ncbi:hypothetical protein F5Y14DRAFT_375387 [Nemania sp. NC0429]|nr:hypothetical protein F5Y14DRAFT_375387 [Nemania sp. NC0429]